MPEFDIDTPDPCVRRKDHFWEEHVPSDKIKDVMDKASAKGYGGFKVEDLDEGDKEIGKEPTFRVWGYKWVCACKLVPKRNRAKPKTEEKDD